MQGATQDSWKTLPMPEQCVTVPLDIHLTEEQMARIRPGHIPEAMEDHWFMYCTERHIRWFRSWSGIFAFEAVYEKTQSGYVIKSLTINQDPDQVRSGIEESRERFRSLIMQACR